MASDLARCPKTIVEAIIEQLDLSDICNLRQSCKCLAIKSSFYQFKPFFRSKRLDMTVNPLQEFADHAKAGLSSFVQNLCLTGIADKSGVEKRGKKSDTMEETKRLTRAFNGLAKHNRNESLTSLTLRLDVIGDSNEGLLSVDARGQKMSQITC